MKYSYQNGVERHSTTQKIVAITLGLLIFVGSSVFVTNYPYESGFESLPQETLGTMTTNEEPSADQPADQPEDTAGAPGTVGPPSVPASTRRVRVASPPQTQQMNPVSTSPTPVVNPVLPENPIVEVVTPPAEDEDEPCTCSDDGGILEPVINPIVEVLPPVEPVLDLLR